MSDIFFSRRDVLKQIGFAGAGAILAPAVIRGQNSPIRIAGMPVEIAVASVSPTTVRITAAAHCRDRRRSGRWRARFQRPKRSRSARGARVDSFKPIKRQSRRPLHRRPADDSYRDQKGTAGAATDARAPTSQACRFCCRRDRCSASAKAGRSSIARARSIGCATGRADISCGRTAAACRSSG